MSSKKRKHQHISTGGVQLAFKSSLRNYFLVFMFGVALATAGRYIVLQASRLGNPVDETVDANPIGHRTVAQLVALSDVDLEKVDILEMNIAVAREIPGLENLNYDKYRKTVDAWTTQFRAWLPAVEHGFYERPEYFKNDINFFRLGMLAQFLDQAVGVRYVEEQKQAQIDARKTGRKAEVAYTDPGHLLLHGLINTRRGTCGTMPALHVAIARRLDWPVSLACVDSHYVCRYEDGQRAYNIEATDTGRGGFAAGSDHDYIEKEGVSRKAIAVGSDLRKLTAREMLGVFVQARARHYADTGKIDMAVRDYALAHTLFPNSRKVYIGLVGTLIESGERLFTSDEHGHPASLAAYLADKYQSQIIGTRRFVPRHQVDPVAEIEAINAINRANMQRMLPPRTLLGPGYPQPGQPIYPQGPQPPR